MRIIGSQRRELLSETEYELISLSESEAILLNTDTGRRELWSKKDDFAGYVVEINGVGYEFVRQIKEVILNE